MKKKTILYAIILLLAFLFSSCAGIPNIDNGGADIWNDSDGPYYEGVLNIGYSDFSKALELLPVIGATVQKHVPEISAFSVTFPGTVGLVKNTLLAALKSDSGLKAAIRYIEPSYKREMIKPVIKDDTTRTGERQVLIPDLEIWNWGSRLVKAPEAWAMGYTGSGVIVAVVDTGIDMTHPDLELQCIGGYAPFTDTVLLPNVDHSQGVETHGTHVAGTIAAENNGFGITGVAYNARIMNIRIFDADSPNPNGYIGDMYVAAGLVWAVNNGAQVTNNSWGGKGYSNTLLEGFNYGLEHNVTHVVSEGNGHTNEIMHPSVLPGMINVAAATASKGITNFSSRGQWLTVAAPGDFTILSTVPLWDAGEFFLGTPYALYGGTSMAAPHVTAVVALIIESLNEESTDSRVAPYTSYQIRQILIQGAEDIMAPGFDIDSGWGLVQADASLEVDISTVELGSDLYVHSDEEEPIYITLRPKGFTAPEYYGKTNEAGDLYFYALDPGEYYLYYGIGEGIDPALQTGDRLEIELLSGEQTEIEI